MGGGYWLTQGWDAAQAQPARTLHPYQHNPSVDQTVSAASNPLTAPSTSDTLPGLPRTELELSIVLMQRCTHEVHCCT